MRKLNVPGLPGYSVVETSPKRGESLRLEVAKVGQAKPYIVTYNPGSFGDSIVPGWGCSCMGWCNKKGDLRKCKHLTSIYQAYGAEEIRHAA